MISGKQHYLVALFIRQKITFLGSFMTFLRGVISSVAAMLLFAAVSSLFWSSKIRGEKNISSEGVIRTRPPKALTGMYISILVFFVIGTLVPVVYLYVGNDKNANVTALIITAAISLILSILCFFGYAFVTFNYVISDDEGIHVYRLFRKEKYFRYEEFGSFKDTINLGLKGELKGFDKNNKKIFAIEGLHIGASIVADRLRAHGVKEQH